MNATQQNISDELKNKRILLVDDDPETTDAFTKFLLSRGYRKVEAINDPRQAKYTIEDFKPDLILLDVMMPHIDGLDLLKRINRFTCENCTAVVMLTAMEDQKTERRALVMGAIDFINKPIGPDELAVRVARALTEQQLELQRSKKNQSTIFDAANHAANTLPGNSQAPQ